MKHESILKIIVKVINVLIKIASLAFLFLFSLIVCLQRSSSNSVSLSDYRLLSIVDGNMIPKYEIGDVLLCKKVDPSTLVIGDDISYGSLDDTNSDKIITHRIINTEKDENDKMLFYTKGIAIKDVEPVVKEEQVYGKITGEVDFLSSLYKYVSTSKGFYIAIIVPLVLLIGSEILLIMVDKENNVQDIEDKEKSEFNIEEVKENSDEKQKQAIKKR